MADKIDAYGTDSDWSDWVGVSDGQMLWFANKDNPDTAFAYSAKTHKRMPERDIPCTINDIAEASWFRQLTKT